MMRPQKRIDGYCCPMLFGAVEEPAAGSMKIDLEYFAPPNCEGSHYWRLTMADDDSRGQLLINYCPFCGNPVRVPGGLSTKPASS